MKTPTFQGSALRRLREEKGLTVQELSYQARVTTPTIYNLENGVTNGPNGATLILLAKALGVRVEEFYKETAA